MKKLDPKTNKKLYCIENTIYNDKLKRIRKEKKKIEKKKKKMEKTIPNGIQCKWGPLA